MRDNQPALAIQPTATSVNQCAPSSTRESPTVAATPVAAVMVATWVLGVWLVFEGGFARSGWLHAKVALVVGLSGLHGYFSAAVRAFAEDRNRRAAMHWRVMNEVPTLLMILIVILVVVKPF